ncbi:MAG: hypothetical protein KatS3mg122_0615 [Caldimonas sp.]|uniref:glycosyltransferase n=1 Tax=Caldimonas taiwanensis TaxID=307483 RepID=UPI000783E0D8|nr:glycosyltransferase [Caldimonas taiwanensis]GIX23384.1 MAG: hypothetical protein KatS3mg122_0615 [Caldimonas sp.]
MQISSRPLLQSLRRPIRAGVHELRLHWERRRSPRVRPVVVIFPSNQPWDPASNLRAWLVAPELERLGWRAIVVPEPLTLSQRRRVLQLEQPDVVLLQQTRHPLNRPALYAGYPCVLDADDADYLDPRYQSMIAQCARDAAAVVGGSRFVADCLGRHNPNSHVIWTGTPWIDHLARVAPAQRPTVVAWAHSSPLDYPEEAALVQRVMIEVAHRTACTFWLFGTHEDRAAAWFAPLRAAGARCEAIAPLPYADYLNKVAQAAVGLQPVCTRNAFSRGKSFGKLLAYLNGRVAVVASDAVDHSLFFRHGVNGYLVGDEPANWVESIVTLLQQPSLRERIANAGYDDARRRLSTRRFAELLDPVLREASSLKPKSPEIVMREGEEERPAPRGSA